MLVVEGVLWSAGGDGAVVCWQGEKGKLFAQLPEPIFCLFADLEGRIWAGTQGGNLYILEKGKKPQLIKMCDRSIFFIESWGNAVVALGLGDGTLCFLNSQGQVLDKIGLGQKSLRCCDGSMGLVGGSDGMVWRLGVEGEVKQVMRANQPSVFCLRAWGQGFVSGGRDALLYGFDDKGEQRVAVKAHQFTIHGLASNNQGGGLLASGSMDKTVKIWGGEDLELLKVLDRGKFASGHTHSVNAVQWVSQRLLASAGDDKVIRLWEIGN